MNEAIRRCPDCGAPMKLVTSLQRNTKNFGKPMKPIRFVCRCGKLVKA